MISIDTDMMREFLRSVSGREQSLAPDLCESLIARLEEFDFWTRNLTQPPTGIQELHSSVGVYTDNAQSEIAEYIASNRWGVAMLEDLYWIPGGLEAIYDNLLEVIYNRTGRYSLLRSGGFDESSLTRLLNSLASDRYIVAFFDPDRFSLEAVRAGNMNEVVERTSGIAVLAFDGEGIIFGQRREPGSKRTGVTQTPP